MARPERKTIKELLNLDRDKLYSIPIASIIQVFNDDLLDASKEEEKVVSWEEGGDDGKGGHIVRLDKELHMMRLILLEKTKGGEEAKLDPKLLVALVKLLSKSERAVGWYADKHLLWRRFLSSLVERMKNEPLEVYKKRESKNPEKKISLSFKGQGDGK